MTTTVEEIERFVGEMSSEKTSDYNLIPHWSFSGTFLLGDSNQSTYFVIS